MADYTGSSPRMRGTQSLGGNLGVVKGIIPAYAGNTEVQNAQKLKSGDHPRVCGEHYADVG